MILEDTSQTYWVPARYVPRNGDINDRWLWFGHMKCHSEGSAQIEVESLNKAYHFIDEHAYFVVEVTTTRTVKRVETDA